MKPLLGLLLACVWLPSNLLAEDYSKASVAKMPDIEGKSIRGGVESYVSLFKLNGKGEILKKNTGFVSPHKLNAKAASPITSISDIAGEWVQTYKTLVSTSADGGKSVTIQVVDAESGSIKIENFFDAGVVVNATVDIAAGTVTIPNQQIFESASTGKLDIAVVEIIDNTTAKPNRSKNIEGVINSDGSISITSDWGIFGMEGANADKFAGLFYDTKFEKANAKMSQTRLINTTNPFTYEEMTYNVIAEQTASNILTVKNFGNWGMTVEIELGRDQSSVINQQVVRKESSGDNYYTNAVVYDPKTGKPTAYSGMIKTDKATDKRSITWKDWTMTNSGSYLAVITEGKLTVPFDINYPSISVSDFSGAGTESDPYLIKSLDDLILLGDKVNSVAEADYNSTATVSGKEYKYNRAFTGKYFRLENDIDMSNYRFAPIGNDFYHRFDGIFDGGNHTLTGVSISTGSAGYAALFGNLDEASVVKNLKLVKPVVRAAGLYAASVVAMSYGAVDNCHVDGADVQNSGRATGGLASVVDVISNSSISNSTVIGLGGNVGGLASEVDGKVSGSYAVDINVFGFGPAATFPIGGLVGSLYYADAENCYFSGMVDGNTLGAKGLYMGGIAGVCVQGSISKCFSVASVFGCNDTETAVGGIAGSFTGSLTDSYSIGAVFGKASKKVGGLTGLISSYVDAESQTVSQSVVSNCYTATQLVADTYSYEAATESRETLGQKSGEKEPLVSNVYFDKQMTNFGSTGSGIKGLNTIELTNVAGLPGLDAEKWSYTDGYYPCLKGIADNEAAKMGASVIALAEGNSLSKLSKDADLKPLGNTQYFLYSNKQYVKEGLFSKIEGNKLLIKDDFGVDTLVVENGKTRIAYQIRVAPVPFDGDGTAANPFLLKSKDDVIALSDITNNKNQYFADTYFKLANDIDMEYAAYESIAGHYNDASVAFAGTIDGDGHTISKLEVNRVVWKIRPEDSGDGFGTPDSSLGNDPEKNSRMTGGFVGRLAAVGVVKNLNFAADCKFEMWSMSGSVVGDCYGVVENCRNYADLKGYSTNIGGIVGQLRKDGKILNCYNAGNVYGGMNNVGGIVGTSYGYLEGNANAGNVEVKKLSKQSTLQRMIKSAGGIVGYANGSAVKNCLNAGTVYAWGDRVGGIAASFSKVSHELGSGKNDMYNTVNYGSVLSDGTDKNTVSAISGEGSTEGTVQNNYWDSQILPLKASGNADKEGMTGIETSVLISGTPLDGLNSELWDFAKGMYPVLKQFANEDKLSKARRVIVSMKPGVTAKNMNQNAKLALVEGLKWSLEQGTEFGLAGSNLYSPEKVDDLVLDTLVADFGDYVKRIGIRRTPEFSLAGSGTAEDPYLISSAADWNALSDYIDLIEEPFAGKSFKVTSDIDFKDVEFKMISAAGSTPFCGLIDGANKRIGGIELSTTGTYQAAIRILGEGGAISNLTLAGNVTSKSASTSGFTSKVYGSLTNCVNEINVTSTSGNGTSGFGYMYAGARLTDVVNKGNIIGAGNAVAGLAAESAEGVEYLRCGNEGKIVSTGSKKSYVAGLVAECDPAIMTECYNKGSIEVAAGSATKYAAGLIAYASAMTSRKMEMTLTNCYNEGDITGEVAAAGLIANSDGSSSISNPLIIKQCYNTGNITAKPLKTQSSSSAPTAGLVAFYTPGSQITDCYNTGAINTVNVNTGGILGYPKMSNGQKDNPILVSNCYNTGTLESTANHVGGIVGYSADYMTIENCYNNAGLKGSFGVGGIVGYINGVNSVVKDSWNLGGISAINRSGGIVGLGFRGVVQSCLNLADVASTSTEVGSAAKTSGFALGGIAGEGTSEYSNCYNLGTVAGANQIGGIIGKPKKSHTIITRCYNMGEVEGQEDTGAIIGADITDDALWNSEYNKVEGSYFTIKGGINNTVGKAVTVAELAKTDMGEGWSSGDDYTLPIPTTHVENPYALINAVTVAFADGDTEKSVTRNFFVGAPEGVVWTSSVSNISFSGFNAEFSQEAYSGNAVLTATAGELSRSFEINCNKADSGVDGISLGKKVVKEVWFNASGVRVEKPAYHDGVVYIVTRTYDDGTVETVKAFNTK